jgi:hypothetical protein
MITIPEFFATETASREGAAGRAWLDRLPMLVDELCDLGGDSSSITPRASHVTAISAS